MPQLTTGRKPLPAAPRPMPVKAASEIGVKRTRRSPNLFSRVEARTVANVITRSSRSISSIIASSSACMTVISRTGVLLIRRTCRPGDPWGPDTGSSPPTPPPPPAPPRACQAARPSSRTSPPRAGGGEPGPDQDVLEARDRVAIAPAPLGQEVGRSQIGLGRVAHGVEEPAERLAVEQGRAVSPTR